MSNIIRVQPAARTDIEEIMAWYEEQKQGLGTRFLNNLSETIRLIGRSPGIFQVRHKNVRQAPVKKFPISVHYIFLKEDRRVVIIAVLHQARNPQVWKGRAQ